MRVRTTRAGYTFHPSLRRTLKEVVDTLTGKKRIPFTDAQRRRLAILGKDLSPKERAAVCEIVKPATILAWFRKLVAQKYDGSQERYDQMLCLELS
ncbi:hypothetical protein ACFL6C_05920 [Myxococcota bacterium]